jgi:hypothetical protein
MMGLARFVVGARKGSGLRETPFCDVFSPSRAGGH